MKTWEELRKESEDSEHQLAILCINEELYNLKLFHCIGLWTSDVSDNSPTSAEGKISFWVFDYICYQK